FGEALKHSLATSETPEISLEEVNEGEKARSMARQEQLHRFSILQEEEPRQWRDTYEVHLQSPEWRSLRNRVHERAGGLCEGCRKRAATEPPPLTYKNLGDDCFGELVVVCSECHRRYHGFADDF